LTVENPFPLLKSLLSLLSKIVDAFPESLAKSTTATLDQ
jgi:hypothetical protein